MQTIDKHKQRHKDLDTIELLIDKNDLFYVLELLVETCQEKAAHVELNWQDKGLAAIWRYNANTIERVIPRISKTF